MLCLIADMTALLKLIEYGPGVCGFFVFCSEDHAYKMSAVAFVLYISEMFDYLRQSEKIPP